MVSIFGLKVGGKKKKSDDKPDSERQAQQWKRVDQNAPGGDGQSVGQNANNRGVVNGGIKSAPRAGMPQLTRSGTAPYTSRDAHNLAAASMFDLGTTKTPRRGSQSSVVLRPHASDANMRTRFGAYNGSSTSLAAPNPGFASRFAVNNGSSVSLATPSPGFSARFGANNGSSTSLAGPGSGAGPRPGTPGRTKPWVDPLDVHFARSPPSGRSPSGPTTPRSPLGSIQLPPTPGTDRGETESVFGEDPDEMVDAVIASIEKQEQEEKEAKRREKELEKQRETARLEMERLERQKSTESTLTARRPSAPQSPSVPQQRAVEEHKPQEPVFRGNIDSRPGSRNGPSCLHQGPPPTGPPTQCLPQPPGDGPPRQGPFGPDDEVPGGRALRQTPSVNAPGPGPGTRQNSLGPQQSRPKGPYPAPLALGSGARAQGPNSQETPPRSPLKVYRPYRPPPLQSCGALGPLPDGLRSSDSPPGTPGIGSQRSETPAIRSPAIRKPSTVEQTPVSNSEGEAPNSRRGTPGPEAQGVVPLISTLTSPPSTATSPTGSIGRSSLDEEPAELPARPVIRNVAAKRDTHTYTNASRQRSLSMKIEELEKTLLDAQKAHVSQESSRLEACVASPTSSLYSDGIKEEDEEDDDGPILSIQPAPLRIPQPMSPPSIPAAAAPSNRPQSPLRGPLRRGPLPRRPALEEYGVSTSQVSNSRGGTPTPASRSGSMDTYNSARSSPPTRTNTPQFRHHNFKRDLSRASPAPTLDAVRPSPVVDTGFNFDFGFTSNNIRPPTPDSMNCSLASPAGEAGPTLPPGSAEPAQTQSKGGEPKGEPSSKSTRANTPAPLNLDFNFSPDAPSRDPTLGQGGSCSPSIQTVPSASVTLDGRPSTSGGPNRSGHGGGLAASPNFASKFPERLGPGDDDPSAFMGIGVARGPSIIETRRPKTSAGRRPQAERSDSLRTGFI
ncbi:hypothetical protein VTH82DRAFT_7872 [Thermothelomyces myriococcoides]